MANRTGCTRLKICINRRCLVYSVAVVLMCCTAWLLVTWSRYTRFSTNINFQADPDNSGEREREREILRRVNKLSFKLKPPPRELLNHRYFSPSSEILENYTNPVRIEPNLASGNVSVHVIIPSAPGDLQTRATIRQTWGSVAQSQGEGHTWQRKPLSLSVRITFVLGVTISTGMRTGQHQSNNDTSITQHLHKDQYVNVDGIKDSQYDDILQFDMVDSYNNLTLKILLALHWVTSRDKNALYIVKADQDTFVNLPLLLSFLKHYGRKNSIYGFIYDGGFVNRVGRWAVSQDAYPPRDYPPYASGTAYVLSRSAAEKIVHLSPHFSYIPIEDAFITGVLASVGAVDKVHVSGFTHYIKNTFKPCDFINDRIYCMSNLKESDLKTIWQSYTAEHDCTTPFSLYSK